MDPTPIHPLRQLRNRLGLTQKQMAEELGLHKVHLSQIETERCGLGRDTALKIVDRYRDAMAEDRITLEDLLRGVRASPK